MHWWNVMFEGREASKGKHPVSLRIFFNIETSDQGGNIAPSTEPKERL